MFGYTARKNCCDTFLFYSKLGFFTSVISQKKCRNSSYVRIFDSVKLRLMCLRRRYFVNAKFNTRVMLLSTPLTFPYKSANLALYISLLLALTNQQQLKKWINNYQKTYLLKTVESQISVDSYGNSHMWLSTNYTVGISCFGSIPFLWSLLTNQQPLKLKKTIYYI